MRNNDVDPASHELGRNLVQPLFLPIRPEILDRNGATLTPAELAQPLHKRGDPMFQCGSRTSAKEPNGRNLRRLLRARRERPRRRGAAEQRDEIATFQLIEWHSAPASQGQIAGYRIDHSQSADILNPSIRGW